MAVEIYTKPACMFCKKAKAMFDEQGITYVEHDVSTAVKFKTMQRRIAGANSVPQIIIDGHLVGGLEVLEFHWDSIFAKLDKSGLR